MKIAALDLGTNSFLCLLGEGTPEQGLLRVEKDLMQVVRLGQGVDKTGKFHPDALIRAEECLKLFKKEIDQFGAEVILAMATSAARDAENGAELFKLGRSLNIPIQIIPGADEARISYQGATWGKNFTSPTLVIDVGGGSTELIVGVKDEIKFGRSLNIGAVRLTEKFIHEQPVKELEKKALFDYIDAQILQTLPDLEAQNISQIIAVAGTPTTIAAIELGGFEEKTVDNYILTQERLKYWVQEFGSTSVEEKKIKYPLGKRADIIFAGAAILLRLLEKIDLPEMIVSTKGVRYGVAVEILKSRRSV